MKVELSDGNWAVLRDPRSLTERQAELLEDIQFELMTLPGVADVLKRKGEKGFEDLQEISEAEQIAQVGPAGLKLLRRLRRAGIVTYVKSWSFESEVNEDSVMDLTREQVMELSQHVDKLLTAVGSKLKTDPTPDPESPTSHSSD